MCIQNLFISLFLSLSSLLIVSAHLLLNEECDSLLSSLAIVFDVVRFISSISFQ